MNAYPLKKEDYLILAENINIFSRVAQIQTVFYSLDKHLLKGRTIYSETQDIQKQLILNGQDIYSIFPVMINLQLWGFLICKSTSVSQQRIRLSRNILENIINQAVEPHLDITISVEDALDPECLSQIRYFDTLLKTSKNLQITSSSDIDESKIKVNTESSSNYSVLEDSETRKNIQATIHYIEKNIHQTISLNEVAHRISFLSPSYLSRMFKQILSVNFIDYINSQKIAIASEKLALTKLPINYISNQIGFSQTSYFTKIFKQYTGLLPSEYRRKNSSIQKVYTIHRDLTWLDDDTVFDVSKRWFLSHNIDYSYQTDNGSSIYVNSINNLADSSGNRGWVYAVNCKQPGIPASNIYTQGVSCVQWKYTTYAN
ncbi:helix-turn-helix domain-containing protein [Oenococcus oeni]